VLHHYQAGTKAARLSHLPHLVIILILVLFDFGFCRPIPSNVNLKKESPVCISFTFEGHGDHSLRKTCHVMAERLGENDTCNIIIKQVKKPQGFRGGSG
jgi:hypothetical protein